MSMGLHEHILRRAKYLKSIGLGDGVERIKKGDCPACGGAIHPNKDFSDERSLREYQLSGLCQKCQDGFLEEDEHED